MDVKKTRVMGSSILDQSAGLMGRLRGRFFPLTHLAFEARFRSYLQLTKMRPRSNKRSNKKALRKRKAKNVAIKKALILHCVMTGVGQIRCGKMKVHKNKIKLKRLRKDIKSKRVHEAKKTTHRIYPPGKVFQQHFQQHLSVFIFAVEPMDVN